VSSKGDDCLMCLDILDQEEVRQDLASPSERRDRDRIYGVDRNFLDEAGPSVVSINGVIASLAVTEFMVTVTEIRSDGYPTDPIEGRLLSCQLFPLVSAPVAKVRIPSIALLESP
jgi:hypothetical protein